MTLTCEDSTSNENTSYIWYKNGGIKATYKDKHFLIGSNRSANGIYNCEIEQRKSQDKIISYLG